MSDNWVCIDDDKEEVIQPLLDGITAADGAVTFDRWRPEPLAELLVRFAKADPAGVLIDLRLDEVANEAGERVTFRGLTFAQELRTRMTEGGQRPIPVVLWSVDAKLKSSYAGDNTGHDLADRVYLKDQDIVEGVDRVAREMKALQFGYKALIGIRQPGDLWPLLGLAQNEESRLDARIIDPLVVLEQQVAHEWASLIVRDLLERPGALIDEDLCAARLGVNRASEDWPQLWTALHADCGYLGVMHEGWPRIWMHRLRDWWEVRSEAAPDLEPLTAAARVAQLQAVTGLERLRPAAPILQDYSSRFWTLCRGHQRPLDPADGVVALVPDLKPWQEKYYLSMDAALRRLGRNQGWRPDSLELPRVGAAAAEADDRA